MNTHERNRRQPVSARLAEFQNPLCFGKLFFDFAIKKHPSPVEYNSLHLLFTSTPIRRGGLVWGFIFSSCLFCRFQFLRSVSVLRKPLQTPTWCTARFPPRS